MSFATEKWRPPIIGAKNNISNNSDHNGHYTDLGPTNVDRPKLPSIGRSETALRFLKADIGKGEQDSPGVMVVFLEASD